MSTPEQRFEVPPEYAEVYERAYRRAYEEGQGQLSGSRPTAPTPRRTSSRGKRVAVPQQRTHRRRGPQQQGAPSRAAERATEQAAPADAGRATGQDAGQRRGSTGHRADPRAGSTILPLLGLGGVMALLLVGAFLLGRATAGTVSMPTTSSTGGEPGATASAAEGPATASSTTHPPRTGAATAAP